MMIMMMMVPIVVTLVGIVTDVNNEHDCNADTTNDKVNIK